MTAFVVELAAIRNRWVLREITHGEALAQVLDAFTSRGIEILDGDIDAVLNSNTDLQQRFGSVR